LTNLEKINLSRVKIEKFNRLVADYSVKFDDIESGQVYTEKSLANVETFQKVYLVLQVDKEDGVVHVKSLATGDVKQYTSITFKKFILLEDIEKLAEKTEEWWKTKS
jgi:hypothetical protein